MTWYYPFDDAVKMREPALLCSLAAGEMDERRLIRQAQEGEWSLSGRLASWLRAVRARRHEIRRPHPLTPELRPVTWQEQMQTR